MAHRFYVNFAPTPGTLVLQGPEARHLATVMRAQPGDRVVLFCGDGREFLAIVESVQKRDVTLTVSDGIFSDRELSFHLEIAVAMPKGDRGDFLIEKLTELGVTRCVPLATERSVVHPRLDRLRRAVIESCKQSGRNLLMEIGEVATWTDYCRQVEATHKYLAHPGADRITPASLLRQVPKTDNLSTTLRIVAAIGPEGGWSDSEVELGTQNGWEIVGLGSRVLRIETAAIALASYFTLSSSNKACRNS